MKIEVGVGSGAVVLVGFVVVLLMTGCASSVLGPLPKVDPTQAGEVVVIRPRGTCSPVWPVVVTLDGQDVYSLTCGEHVVFAVPVGERIVGLNFWTQPDPTAVTVSTGSRYHLRLRNSASGPVLKLTTLEVGERLMQDTKAQSPHPARD